MTSPRTIVFLVSSMHHGGAERVAAHMVNAWAARGDNVTLIVTYSGGGRSSFPISHRVKVVVLADVIRGKGRGLHLYWKRFWTLRKLLGASRPDCIVSFLTNVNVTAVLANIGLGYRLLVSERNYPPLSPPPWPYAVMRRLTYPFASKVVMLSTEGLQWLETNIPRAQGVTIPNPVALPLPQGYPELDPSRYIGAEQRVILAVGRLEPQKGFDMLLEAFALLSPRQPNWHLVLLGEGKMRGSLEASIESLNLNDRVKLPGRAGNMSSWYRRADVYVLSSRYEGFPNTLLEAMAHGCPSVSFDCDTGPRSIIRHEIDGLLVKPCDVAALARALEQLAKDGEKRARMSKAATEVRLRYSLDRIVADWDMLLDASAEARQVEEGLR